MSVAGGIICKQFVSYAMILSIRKIILTLWYQFNKAALLHIVGYLPIDTDNWGLN